jgi:hypothetical protein
VGAGPFITERALDEHEVRWRRDRSELTGGGYTNEQLAAGSKQLFCNEHGERRSNSAPNQPDRMAFEFSLIQSRVVARPCGAWACASSADELAYHVAVRIQRANGRYSSRRQAFLPPSLPEQILGQQNGGGVVVLQPVDRCDLLNRVLCHI